MRIGAKKKPFYRVVAVDERAKRTGGYLELLGTYNPLSEPKDIKLKQDRINYWIKQGAQPSTGYLRIIGKAPQRLPGKPKKEKKEEQPVAISEQPAEKAEETKTEEPAPTEEVPTNASDGDSVSEAKADSSEVKQAAEEKPEKIATEPEAPRNDENVEEKKDEGSA